MKKIKKREYTDRGKETKNYILISTSTPAGSSRCPRLSMVFSVGETISISLLCIRISKWSRAFLSTKGDLLTANIDLEVGRGIGPTTLAPVRIAVSKIC